MATGGFNSHDITLFTAQNRPCSLAKQKHTKLHLFKFKSRIKNRIFLNEAPSGKNIPQNSYICDFSVLCRFTNMKLGINKRDQEQSI